MGRAIVASDIRLIVLPWCHCLIPCDDTRVFPASLDAAPLIRLCESTAGVTPPAGIVKLTYAPLHIPVVSQSKQIRKLRTGCLSGLRSQCIGPVPTNAVNPTPISRRSTSRSCKNGQIPTKVRNASFVAKIYCFILYSCNSIFLFLRLPPRDFPLRFLY